MGRKVQMRAERLQQRVAPQQGQQHVLGNVRVADVHTMDDLLLLLTQLLDTLEGGADEAGLQLLVIDCFADLALPRVHAHPRETGLDALHAPAWNLVDKEKGY